MGRIFDGYCDKIDPTENSFDDLIAANFKLQRVSVRNAKCQNEEKHRGNEKHVFDVFVHVV